MDHPRPHTPNAAMPEKPGEFADALNLLLTDAAWAVEKHGDTRPAEAATRCLLRWRDDPAVSWAAARAMESVSFDNGRLIELRRALTRSAVLEWRTTPDPHERVDVLWRYAERAQEVEDFAEACELYAAAVRECETTLTGDPDSRLAVLAQLLFEQQDALSVYEAPEAERPAQLRDRVAGAEHLVWACRELAEADPDRYGAPLANAHLTAARAKTAADDDAAAIANVETALRCYDANERRQSLSQVSIDRRHDALRFLITLLRRTGDESRAEQWDRHWNAWLRDVAARAPQLGPGEQIWLADKLWDRDLYAEAISVSSAATDHMSQSTMDDRATLGRLASALYRLGDRFHLTGRRDEAAAAWRRFIDAEHRRGRIGGTDGPVIDAHHRVIRRVVALDDTALALDFDATLVGELTRLATATGLETYGPELVNALRAQADRLQPSARTGEAADTAERAVDWAQQLAEAGHHHRPLLAEALTTAIFHHAKAHRARDADRRSRQALDVIESLAETDPDRYGPDLARALHNRAVTLTQLKDDAVARPISARALELYDGLVDEHPDLLHSQANALCTHASILRDLHESEAALECTRRAVDIYTDLVESDPDDDGNVLNLCHAHTKVTLTLTNLGRHEDARRAALAALAVSERLSPGDERDEARVDALHAVVTSRIDSGHAQAALPLSVELVALRERCAERDPVAAESELAIALENHSLCLRRVGRPREALDYAQRGLVLFRRESESEPDQFRPRLAGALDTVALLLRKLHRYEEALSLSNEALALCDELLAANRDGHLSRVMDIVSNHASVLDDVNRREEALEVAQRSIVMAEELAALNRDRYLKKLVISLLNQSARLNELDRHDEAELVALRGVRLAEELYGRDADAHRNDLAATLHNLANALCQQDRYAEALPRLQRAADLGEAELEHHRYPGLMLLRFTLDLLAGLHLRLGQRIPAEQRTWQAIRGRRELAEFDPALHLPGLADSLRTLSQEWSDEQGWDLTAQLASEGLDVCERLAETDPAEHWPQAALMAERLCHALANREDRDGAFAAADRALAARHAAIRAGAEGAEARLAGTEVILARKWLRLDDLAAARQQQADGLRRYRDLIAAGRDDLRADLAEAHRQFGIALGDNGFRTEALAPIVEALSMVRNLVAQDRSAHLERLGEVLSDYAWFLSEAGQKYKAVRVARETVSVIDECDGDDRQWEHANAHDVLAKCLGDIGAVDESLAHSATALARWESMAVADEYYLLDLAWCLRHRARVLVERDGPTPANLALSQRALGIYTDRVAEHPDEKPDLAGALVDHLRHLDRGGLPADDNWDRALSLWEELAADRPRVHRPGLADCLHRHAEHLLRRGRGALDRALATYPQAPDGHRNPHAERITEARATRERLTWS